ncbi:MAG TPA: hypothetical protein VMT20_17645 [Terriglobia bacterium]|nr:hypothetical protein [Terriglobia bacterium]
MAPHAFCRNAFFGLEPRQSASRQATRALVAAFHDTADLLLRPVDAVRWLKLSVLCLLLGGGTPSAAFNWSLGLLPGDIGFRELIGRASQTVTAHTWLIALVALVGAGLFVGILYLRSVFRFALVDAIAQREVHLRSSLKETRRPGRSYFRWLLGIVAGVSLSLLAGGMLVYPYLRAAAAEGIRSPSFWALLVGVLVVDVLIGLVVALVIVLTDDLVVPIMYAENLMLPSAWAKLLPKLRAEPAAFAVYVLLRFAVSLATSVATLFLLFPLLLGLFSGAIISGALVVLALHFLGFFWSWNPLTVSVTAAGFTVLVSLVLAVLSVVAMPAQLLIQDFGICFIAARFPSVQAVLQAVPAEWMEGFESSGGVSP